MQETPLFFSRSSYKVITVKGSPISSLNQGEWHPLHVPGQLDMLIARVISSGTSENTTLESTYFIVQYAQKLFD